MLQYINNPGAYPVQKSKVELIHQIETAVEEANQDEEWRRMYMTWQIRQREAELLGEKRGIAIGEERGIAIGEKRGEERGEKRGKLETARAMLKELPMDQVARFTGLSREELQSLAGEISPQG